MTELEKGIRQLREAIQIEGPCPQMHRSVMARYKREWPSLWKAIDKIMDATEPYCTQFCHLFKSPKKPGDSCICGRQRFTGVKDAVYVA